MEQCRSARPGDLERLLELAHAARAEFIAERGGPMWSRREAPPEPRRSELLAAMADVDALVQLGTVDDYPVGYGVVRVERLRTGEDIAVVSDIFVEAPFRGVAVGEAVMDTMVSWARSRQCVGVDSLVLPGMRESKNFFERYGMKARALLVHLPLVDERESGDEPEPQPAGGS